MTREEYEALQREKAELEAKYHTLVYEEWSSYCREFGLKKEYELWEA